MNKNLKPSSEYKSLAKGGYITFQLNSGYFFGAVKLLNGKVYEIHAGYKQNSSAVRVLRSALKQVNF